MEHEVNVVKRRRARVLVVAVVLVIAAGCRGDENTALTATSTPGTSASPTAEPTEIFPYDEEGAVVEAGTYRIPASAWSVADFEVTFGEGWTVQYGHVFHKPSASPDGLEFYAVVPDAIFADGCRGSDSGLTEVGPSVDEFVTALLEQPGAKKGRPIATTLGGHPAIRINLAVPDGYDMKACNLGKVGFQIWYSSPADKWFVLLRDNPTDVYIVDVNGQRLVFIAGPMGPMTTRHEYRELQAVLDSIRFDP